MLAIVTTVKYTRTCEDAESRGGESSVDQKGGTPFGYLSFVPAAPWLEALARVNWGWRRNELSQNRTLTSSTPVVY